MNDSATRPRSNGAHEVFYRFSRDLYWPYFERLGARHWTGSAG
ncbi:MAG: hypothetical protein ABL982_14185 [Vicinamibacterales bacterium]